MDDWQARLRGPCLLVCELAWRLNAHRSFSMTDGIKGENMPFSGKTVIVTGGARGIGRACADEFAAGGANVVIADQNDNDGEQAAADLKDAGHEALFVSCDVSERLDVHNLIARGLETYDQIDVLVNNAAIIDSSPFLDLSEKEFDHVLSVNLKGYFLVGQAVARQMVAQIEDGKSPGAIINMSSVNAQFALADHVAYTVTKGGIAQLTKAMALALAPHGIRVNAIGPGSIMTPILESVAQDEKARARILSRTPLGRIGEPREIAAIAVFLASDAASYVTGETVYADGGRLALNYTVGDEA